MKNHIAPNITYGIQKSALLAIKVTTLKIDAKMTQILGKELQLPIETTITNTTTKKTDKYV